MKKLVLLTLTLTLLGCGASRLRTTNPENVPQGPDGVKGKIAEPTENTEDSQSTLKKSIMAVEAFSDDTRVGGIMNFLAADDLKGRDSGSEGIEMAAVFIEGIFKQNGIRPYFSSYRDTLSNFSKPAYNVVGVLEGTDPQLKNEYIVIGAHYDHIGIVTAENGDTIANGANDNASGTTMVLELARYFGNARNNKRSLIFALFSAEEKGLLGSRHLANKLKSQDLNLYTMLNFEMIGVPMVGKDYFLYITGYEKSNLAEVSNSYTEENLIGFLPTAKEFNLFQRSDNYPFHEIFNVPSHTYCTFDFTNFNYYHKAGDEVSEMDFPHMARMINKMIPILVGITNSSIQEIKYN